MKLSKITRYSIAPVILGTLLTGTFLIDNSGMSSSVIKAESPAQLAAKEEIHTKMLNSIDHFDRVKGSFTYHSDAANYEYLVEYNVNVKNTPSSHVKIRSTNNEYLEHSFSQDTGVVSLDHKQKAFKKHEVAEFNQVPLNKNVKSRYTTTPQGEKVYNSRLDPTFMNMASLSVFPQDFGLGFLEDYSKWEITSNNEKVNGHEVTTIEGVLNESYQQRHQTKTFKMWVHTSTGILLKMEEYNKDGKATEYVITHDIKINDNKIEKPKKLNVPSEYKEKVYKSMN